MLMLFTPLLFAQASAPPPPTMEEVQANACFAAADKDPAAAIAEANGWMAKGGGWRARQCLAQAYAKARQFRSAEQAFAEAAREAKAMGQADWAKLTAQAGNAALAGGDAARAAQHLTAALADPWFVGEAKGELYLDRARALAAREDWKAVRADLDQATVLVPRDPLAWLFSATLSRRQKDLARAKTDIAVAARLAPQDGYVALEAGNIAAEAGDLAGARKNWEAAVLLDKGGEAAGIAAQRLKELGAAPAAPAPAAR